MKRHPHPAPETDRRIDVDLDAGVVPNSKSADRELEQFPSQRISDADGGTATRGHGPQERLDALLHGLDLVDGTSRLGHDRDGDERPLPCPACDAEDEGHG